MTLWFASHSDISFTHHWTDLLCKLIREHEKKSYKTSTFDVVFIMEILKQPLIFPGISSFKEFLKSRAWWLLTKAFFSLWTMKMQCEFLFNLWMQDATYPWLDFESSLSIPIHHYYYHNIIIVILLFVFGSGCERHGCVLLCACGGQRTILKSVLSVHYVGCRDQTQVIRIGVSTFTPTHWDILPTINHDLIKEKNLAW